MIFDEIKTLFTNNSALFGVTIAVVSMFVNQLVFSFINDIIMPVIDRDGNDDNNPDINKIADYNIKVGGITFKIGAFIIALIRFVLVMFFLFIVCVILVKKQK